MAFRPILEDGNIGNTALESSEDSSLLGMKTFGAETAKLPLVAFNCSLNIPTNASLMN